MLELNLTISLFHIMAETSDTTTIGIIDEETSLISWGPFRTQLKLAQIDKLDKLVAELNEDALTNFHIEKTSHSDIKKFRKEVKTIAVLASKEKAVYLAKSVGEEIGETLLIEEVEFENPEYLGYRGYGGYYSNNVTLSNASITSYDTQSSGGDSPGFKKIKLRYEIKAAYRLK